MIRAYADLSQLRQYAASLEGQRLKRSVIGAKRELEVWGDSIINHARSHQGRYFDNPSQSDGLADHGIDRDDHAKPSGGVLTLLVGWLRAYGAVLEFGPLRAVRGWLIQAKRARALRWYTAEGGGVGAVAYAKHLWHPWDESQKREHLGPAAQKTEGAAQARIQAALAKGFV